MKRILRLDWKRCPAGYAVEDRPATHGRAEYDGTLLEETRPPSDGAFITSRSAVRKIYSVEGIVDNSPVEDTDDDSHVEDNGEKELVCLALANTLRTPAGVMDFAEDWGLLYGHSEERIADAFELIDQLNQAIRDLQDVGSAKFLRCLNPKARAGLTERSVDGNAYRQASCLAVFCRHQLIELAEAGREVGRCHFCSTIYAPRIRTGERSKEQQLRFCRKLCRNRNNSKGLDKLQHRP